MVVFIPSSLCFNLSYYEQAFGKKPESSQELGQEGHRLPVLIPLGFRSSLHSSGCVSLSALYQLSTVRGLVWFAHFTISH